MSVDLDALIDLELATPRYRRRSHLLNDLFLTNTHGERLQAAKNTVDFLVPLYAALIAFDFVLLPDVAAYSVLCRWIVGPLMWCIVRGRKRASVDWMEWSIAAAIFTAMLMVDRPDAQEPEPRRGRQLLFHGRCRPRGRQCVLPLSVPRVAHRLARPDGPSCGSGGDPPRRLEIFRQRSRAV